MICVWMRITTTLCVTLAATSATRDTGETRKRSMIPRSIALIHPMPCQPADPSALIITPADSSAASTAGERACAVVGACAQYATVERRLPHAVQRRNRLECPPAHLGELDDERVAAELALQLVRRSGSDH